MTNFYSVLKLLFKRIGILFISYQFCRVLFLLLNKNSFPNVTLDAFFGGMLFDLSAIGFINLIFIFLHLVPGNFKYKLRYQKGLKLLFFIVNLTFIATNFVDFEYYKFTGRRSSFSLITAKGMEHELPTLIPSFIKEFWYLPLGMIGLGLLLWKLFSTARLYFPLEKLTVKEQFKQIVILFLCMSIGLLMSRGGFQKNPLRIVDAINFSNLGNASLVLNTPFSIMKTIGKKGGLKVPEFYSEKDLDIIFNPIIKTNSDETIKKNVVVVILESFGDENLHQGYTPFLDSLIKQSYYFKNAFANGKVSIDAVPSIFSSIPSLMNTSLISSCYSINKVYALPKILKKQGYHSSFFHGAINGSQNFDQYCKIAGFDSYYGRTEYANDTDFDGVWGIYDEEFMQFFCHKINTFKQPFLTSVFTLSSHNPFLIPKKYKGKFPKGTTEIHESIAYSDFALRQFFTTAKKQPWYNNTLFVFSADHTSHVGKGKYKTSIGKFRIPILFFDPSNPELKGTIDKNFQQIDILPSIIDYLNIKDNVISYGKSYLSNRDFVVTYLDNVYNYVDGDYYLAFDGQKSIGLYNWKKDVMLKTNLLKTESKLRLKMEKFIKAYIQSFNTRIINDQLVLKPN